MTAALVLLYRFAAGDVLPHLHLSTGNLPAADMRQIDEWLCENYRDLAAHRKKVVEVPRKLHALPNPASFLIETIVENEARNPTLRLEYQPSAPAKSDLPLWANDLLTSLEGQLLNLPEGALPAPMQRQIAKAMVELQTAARRDPLGTAQNLLQGFILMRRRRRLTRRYVAGCRKLKQISLCLSKLRDALPSKPDPPKPSSNSATPKDWSLGWPWPFNRSSFD